MQANRSKPATKIANAVRDDAGLEPATPLRQRRGLLVLGGGILAGALVLCGVFATTEAEAHDSTEGLLLAKDADAQREQAESQRRELEEQRKLFEAQRCDLEEQRKVLGAQRRELETQRTVIEVQLRELERHAALEAQFATQGAELEALRRELEEQREARREALRAERSLLEDADWAFAEGRGEDARDLLHEARDLAFVTLDDEGCAEIDKRLHLVNQVCFSWARGETQGMRIEALGPLEDIVLLLKDSPENTYARWARDKLAALRKALKPHGAHAGTAGHGPLCHAVREHRVRLTTPERLQNESTFGLHSFGQAIVLGTTLDQQGWVIVGEAGDHYRLCRFEGDTHDELLLTADQILRGFMWLSALGSDGD